VAGDELVDRADVRRQIGGEAQRPTQDWMTHDRHSQKKDAARVVAVTASPRAAAAEGNATRLVFMKKSPCRRRNP
jgi:hypothetical protein